MGFIMRMSFLSFLVCAYLITAQAQAADLEIGTTEDGQLIYSRLVQYAAIPLKIRTKVISYKSDSLIKGLSVINQDDTKSSVWVMSGGVGSTFVKVKMSSELGEALNYQVQIFV